MFEKKFVIEDFLLPFVEEASVRLRYLFPDVEFRVVDDTIIVRSSDAKKEASLAEEVNYALYRAKIRNDGIANRAALYSAVFNK